MTNYEIIEQLRLIKAVAVGASYATTSPVNAAFCHIADMVVSLHSEILDDEVEDE